MTLRMSQKSIIRNGREEMEAETGGQAVHAPGGGGRGSEDSLQQG